MPRILLAIAVLDFLDFLCLEWQFNPTNIVAVVADRQRYGANNKVNEPNVIF